MTIPTSPEQHAIRNLKQISREEFILPGTALCGGCGRLPRRTRALSSSIRVTAQ
jgi:hypothetical protein